MGNNVIVRLNTSKRKWTSWELGRPPDGDNAFGWSGLLVKLGRRGSLCDLCRVKCHHVPLVVGEMGTVRRGRSGNQKFTGATLVWATNFPQSTQMYWPISRQPYSVHMVFTCRIRCSILFTRAFPRELSCKWTTRVSVMERCLVTHRLRTRSFTTSVKVGSLTQSAAAVFVMFVSLSRRTWSSTPAWSGVTPIGSRLRLNWPCRRNTCSNSEGASVSSRTACGILAQSFLNRWFHDVVSLLKQNQPGSLVLCHLGSTVNSDQSIGGKLGGLATGGSCGDLGLDRSRDRNRTRLPIFSGPMSGICQPPRRRPCCDRRLESGRVLSRRPQSRDH